MTIQIMGGEPETVMLRWLNYLGLVVASDKQKEADKVLKETLSKTQVDIKTEEEVEEDWNGEKVSFQTTFTAQLLKEVMEFKSFKRDPIENLDEEQGVAKAQQELLPYINQYMDEFKMDCFERIHFFAQISVETGKLSALIEKKSSYKSSTSTYKGRGILQITGRRNYKLFQDYCQTRGEVVNFVDKPELLEQPKYAVLSGFWYWQVCNLKRHCTDLSIESLLKVSKIINCGSITSNCSENHESEPCHDCKPNGWEHRKNEFNRLKGKYKCE